jgi:hypothetical protein
MRCRRISRELLWLARFGEFGPSSAPHLDHLVHCGQCRDEVGFDRALVRQLRIALAERANDANPSPAAWGVIRQRAQTPERGIAGFLHDHAAALAARLRTATAISAIALAGVIATSTQVAITHPEAGSAEAALMQSTAGEQFERAALVPRPPGIHGRVPVNYVAVTPPSDPEAAFLVSASQTSIVLVTTGVEPSFTGVVAPADETTIESKVLIGARTTQLAGADPVEALGASSVEAIIPVPDRTAGEPF